MSAGWELCMCSKIMAKNKISLGQGNRNWITTWNGLILCGSKCDCVHLNSLSCDLVCGMSYISLVPRPIISRREISLVSNVHACSKYPTIQRYCIFMCTSSIFLLRVTVHFCQVILLCQPLNITSYRF